MVVFVGVIMVMVMPMVMGLMLGVMVVIVAMGRFFGIGLGYRLVYPLVSSFYINNQRQRHLTMLAMEDFGILSKGAQVLFYRL